MKNKIILAFAITVFIVGIVRNSKSATTLVEQGRNFNSYSGAAVTASGTNSSDVFSAFEFNTGTMQVVWAGHTGDTSTFEVQASVDGSTYDTVAGTSTTTSGTTGSESFNFLALPSGYLRVTITEASTTGSTLTPYFVGKKGR